MDGCISKTQFDEFQDALSYAAQKVEILRERLKLMEKMMSNERIEDKIKEIAVQT